MAAATSVLNGTKKRHQAALLVAEDDLSDMDIAEAVGIGRTTLSRWKTDPEFNALVGDQVGQLNGAMLKLTIAKKRKRLEVLDALHDRANQVIAHRAERHATELEDGETPVSATKRIFGDVTPAEAATGLLVKQETVNNSGMKTVNWSVDTGLMKEIRALQEQAAKELGQWEENVNLKHGGMVRTIVLEDD